jgi:hypothetical protein
MKNSFRTYAVCVAVMYACLALRCHAETVLSQTYYRSAYQGFSMSVHADHTDDWIDFQGPPVVYGYSNVYVLLNVIVRDADGNVISNSNANFQLSGGEVDDVGSYEDIGMHFQGYTIEPATAGYTAELDLDVDFSPPGTSGNYSVEVTLEKYVDSEDTHHVSYTIW